MDLADQAQTQNSIAEQHNLLTSRKPEGPKATGYCFGCGEQFPPSDKTRRFCDADCRDDWEAANPRYGRGK